MLSSIYILKYIFHKMHNFLLTSFVQQPSLNIFIIINNRLQLVILQCLCEIVGLVDIDVINFMKKTWIILYFPYVWKIICVNKFLYQWKRFSRVSQMIHWIYLINFFGIQTYPKKMIMLPHKYFHYPDKIFPCFHKIMMNSPTTKRSIFCWSVRKPSIDIFSIYWALQISSICFPEVTRETSWKK
jgi:hypothetical protein